MLGPGKLTASDGAYAKNSGSLRVAQDCSPPMIGLAIEPRRSEIKAEVKRRLQNTSLGERIVRERSGLV